MTIIEAGKQFNEACLDLFYQISKGLGLISLIKNLKFLQLKQWVKDRKKQDETDLYR
jgi:hypothetical protein